jgi:ADP-ribosylglycohydrolase
VNVPKLFDKMYGCLAGSQVGSALGGPVEAMTHEMIREKYGVLDRMVEYPYGDENGPFPPGTTEDGVERQKLMALAIIDKGGRINARDLAKSWLKYVKEDSFGRFAGQQDEIHYRLIKAGISPEDAGRHDAHVGRMGFNRACHPIGMVNACFPYDAAMDALDCAKLYQPPSGRGILWKDDSTSLYGQIFPAYSIGIDWAAAVSAGIAEAMKPQASRDSVVERATAYIVEAARDEILRAVELAARCKDYEELVSEFGKIYMGQGLPYAMSRAYEVTSKGFAVFWFCDGDVRETLISAVNFGRDTDCLASVAAGLAGALAGVEGIPGEWIDQVDEATKQNRYTVSQQTIDEMARGIYASAKANGDAMRSSLSAIDELAESEK